MPDRRRQAGYALPLHLPPSNPPINMLRLCLHPKGFTPQVMNYSEWRGSVLKYLERQVEATADAVLMELLHEFKELPKT
jgi:hypothetical protein